MFNTRHDADVASTNPYNPEISLYKPWTSKVVYQFENIINDLVGSFHTAGFRGRLHFTETMRQHAFSRFI